MKILLVDVGNTLIKIAVSEKKIKVYDVIEINSFNLEEQLKNFFHDPKLKFDNAIVSCVVPKVLPLIEKLINNNFKIKPIILNKTLIQYLPIKINLNNPQLGNDLMALSVGGIKKYNSVIIVSLGTATTYSIVTNKELVGVIIGPGLVTSIKALINDAALLSQFNLQHFTSMLGKDTNHALSIGFGFGFATMIKGTIAKIETELKESLPVIITGGNTMMLKSYFDFNYDYQPQLLLEGLLMIFQQLVLNSNKIN